MKRINLLSQGVLGFFATLTGLLGGISAQGDPVSSGRAVEAARGWLRMEPAPLGQARLSVNGAVQTVNGEDGAPLYHVVKLEPSGFALVASDDQIVPVLAFSSSGEFRQTPENPLYTLAGRDMAARLKKARATSAAQAFVVSDARWARLAAAAVASAQTLNSTPSDVRVEPLVLSKWSQSTISDYSGGTLCYNYYTPKNYPCGCVATAMAQISRYHVWPTNGIGVTSYTVTVDSKTATYKTRGGNGAGGAYDWDNMPLDATNATTAECQAIGALTYDLAVAAHTEFTKSSSSSTLQDAMDAFLAFGFASAVYGDLGLITASSTKFYNMINANLDARKPVFFGVEGVNGNHAVVCDGYGYSSGVAYHHINPGWSGTDNAWYNLPTIDTSEDLFTNLFGVVYNVFPKAQGEIISGRALEASGAPIAGATVLATNSQGTVFTNTTDSHGVYAICGVPSNTRCYIGVRKSGYLPTNSSRLTTASGESAAGNVWGANFTLTRVGPPVIATDLADTSVGEGGTASLTFGVLGSAPIYFNWFRNDASYARGTSATLTLTNLQISDSGSSFYCVASNALGSVTSRVATLTVYVEVADHFVIGKISSPQVAGLPFAATVTACDAAGGALSNYLHGATLQAWNVVSNDSLAEGFESGSLDAWDDQGGGYTMEIDTNTAAVGSNSLTMIGAEGYWDWYYYTWVGGYFYDGLQHTFSDPIQPGTVSFYVRAAQTNASVGYVVAGEEKYRANSVFYFLMDSLDFMGLADPDGVYIYGKTYKANQWYKITLNLNWTARALDFYIDGALVKSNFPFCNTNISDISVVNLFNTSAEEADSIQVWWDQFQFLSGQLGSQIPLSPATITGFKNGVWTGKLTASDLSTNAVVTADDGSGHTGTSNPFVVTNANKLAPVITAQPQGATNLAGTTAVTMTISTVGADPKTFRWRKNGIALSDNGHYSGTASPTLAIAQTAFSDNGTYTVAVTNKLGSAISSNATLAVLSAPAITTQPADVAAPSASKVSLTVQAVGSAPLVFQWFKDGTPVTNQGTISGAKGSNLVFSSAKPTNSGAYWVVLSNAVGMTTSRTATVLILDIPTITNQPSSATIAVGARALLSVGASGNNLVYQWKRGSTNLADGNGLSGAQSPYLVFAAAALTNSASYTIVISNFAGRVESKAAKLTVLLPPSILAATPVSQAVVYGSNAAFNVAATGSAPLGYQWYFNSSALADKTGQITGSRVSNLVVKTVDANDAGSYWVVATNAVGASTSAVVSLSIAPFARIVFPTNNATLTNASFTAKGTASDTGGPGLVRVRFQLNGGDFTDASGLTTNWNAAIQPVSGTNTLAVKSVDANGVESPVTTVKFVYNPYASLAGSYCGLMGADAAAPERAGFLRLTLSASGIFSGAFVRPGASNVLTGKFDWTGASHIAISTSPALSLDLSLPVDGSTGGLSGVFNAANWTGAVQCVQGATQAKTNYSLALLNDGADGAPNGDGVGSIIIAATGQTSFSGWLPDNTAFSSPQGTIISTNGLWPFFAAINGGKGVLAGWLQIDSAAGTMSGTVNWIKPAKAGTNFTDGFTNVLNVEASALVSGRLLPFTTGWVILNGDGLETPLTNLITWNATNGIAVAKGQTNSLALTTAAASGQITGSFVHPVTLKKLTIRGAVLNRQGGSLGHFTGPQTGWFQLEPAQ